MKIEVDLDRLVTDHARAALRADDANPDVGMGLFPHMAVDRALAYYGYTKADVAYDQIVATLQAERRRRWR